MIRICTVGITITITVVVLFVLWGRRGHDPSIQPKPTCSFERYLHNECKL